MKGTESNNKGFSLVEVVIVLVVLAILAAIMIPALTGWIDEAKEKICISNRAQLLRYYQYEKSLHYLDAEPVTLAKVMAGNYDESKGDVTAMEKCPSDGTYQPVGDTEISCSKHGQMGAALLRIAPGDALIQAVGEALNVLSGPTHSKSSYYNGIQKNAQIDSTAPAEYNGTKFDGITQMRKAILGLFGITAEADGSLPEGEIGSWMVWNGTNTNVKAENADRLTYYWTPNKVSEISTITASTKTNVIQYVNGNYQIGSISVEKTRNYNTLKEGSFTKADGTENYTSYEEAKAAFEKLP